MLDSTWLKHFLDASLLDGSLPYLQTLDYTKKACKGQKTLAYNEKFCELRP